MGRPERIGSDPFHQFKITFDHSRIVAASDDITVLMLSKPFQVYRMAIEYETVSLDLKGTDSDFFAKSGISSLANFGSIPLF